MEKILIGLILISSMCVNQQPASEIIETKHPIFPIYIGIKSFYIDDYIFELGNETTHPLLYYSKWEGYATVGGKRIVLKTNHTFDWIEIVCRHEKTHIFTLDEDIAFASELEYDPICARLVEEMKKDTKNIIYGGWN